MSVAFDIDLKPFGIADILKSTRLRVPPNQRPYAWKAEHINQLFDDWADAFQSKAASHYFLRTIVLNKTADPDILEVSDGQQRLATTAIFIAAVRDVLDSLGKTEMTTAEKYTRSYLIEYEELEGDWVERLKLNTQDNVYFRREILVPRSQREDERVSPGRRGSNERLAKAYELAQARVATLMNSVSKENRIRHLYEWINFLIKKVVVIVITVPEDVDAFTMFETLNDRGLRASQVDNIKNRLFKEAGNRLEEAEELWLSMVSQIESFGTDKTIISYLRHYWISDNGPTREQHLARQFKESMQGQAQVATFIRRLDDHVVDYEALFYSPLEHKRLSDLSKNARGYAAATTTVLGIEQIRPLMLAVLRNFTQKDIETAFRLMLAWSVRFLVVGTGGGGLLDRNYGLLAKNVSKGEIANVRGLRVAMEGIVPNDTQYEASFRAHSISDSETARYVCRSLEAFERGETHPSIMFFDNPNSFNLEHILPRRPHRDWNIDPDLARGLYKRIGNLTLLDPEANVEIGNLPMGHRSNHYSQSPFKITQELAQYRTWGPNEIEARQARFAAIAPSIWPLK